VKEHLDVIRHLIMSDGSHLELSGCVNIKNVWYWSEDIPNEMHVEPFYRQGVTAWSVMSTFGIVCPFFFF